jgi:glutamate racemase
VELVEAGKSNSQEAKVLLMKYISPMLSENIDHLVLGCTHYPFFTPLLKELLPPNVVIVNPAPAVAQQAVRVLTQMSKPIRDTELSVNFYASGSISILKELVELLEFFTKIEFEKKQFFPNSLV